jgi:hypothetical protein
LAIINRILQRFIGQRVPLLEKINPQHPLQADRRTAPLAFRIKRLDHRDQPCSRHHPFHLGEKQVPPCRFLFGRIFVLGEAELFLDPFVILALTPLVSLFMKNIY